MPLSEFCFVLCKKAIKNRNFIRNNSLKLVNYPDVFLDFFRFGTFYSFLGGFGKKSSIRCMLPCPIGPYTSLNFEPVQQSIKQTYCPNIYCEFRSQPRLLAALILIIVLFIFSDVMTKVDTDTWQIGFMGVTLFTVVIINIAVAIFQVS